MQSTAWLSSPRFNRAPTDAPLVSAGSIWRQDEVLKRVAARAAELDKKR